ncbi:hypothetical protein SEA_HORUS_101 [Gordonia phage Horus]|uniref:Uncharacterized protein n=1 Tax=Gordonia phage Horus TaxID=2301696 RepID=A0A385DWV5_9CAUD|nr:hypothetical protein HOT93_gp049 [Gordonia phage Horus]AXQ63953.1 hypothetical protein SEA_HORUS_101 [Gordonia phage Horus]
MRVLGLTLLDLDLTDQGGQDDSDSAGVESMVTSQDSAPRFGFIPGHVEYDKPQP